MPLMKCSVRHIAMAARLLRHWCPSPVRRQRALLRRPVPSVAVFGDGIAWLNGLLDGTTTPTSNCPT